MFCWQVANMKGEMIMNRACRVYLPLLSSELLFPQILKPSFLIFIHKFLLSFYFHSHKFFLTIKVSRWPDLFWPFVPRWRYTLRLVTERIRTKWNLDILLTFSSSFSFVTYQYVRQELPCLLKWQDITLSSLFFANIWPSTEWQISVRFYFQRRLVCCGPSLIIIFNAFYLLAPFKTL